LNYAITSPNVSPDACTKSWTRATRDGRPHGIAAVVLPTSPTALRTATQRMAEYFRREFGYDFPQYSASPRGEPDARTHAYLWTAPDWCSFGPQPVVGAACFRWRTWSGDRPNGIPAESYEMDWMWLHPYVRRTGMLTRAWEYFLAAHGPFVPGAPFSPAMDEFLRKHNYHPERWARANVEHPVDLRHANLNDIIV
jgi:hypothetical protein